MSNPCVRCGHGKTEHDPEPDGYCNHTGCSCHQWIDEPGDDYYANGPGREGGIGYPLGDPFVAGLAAAQERLLA